MIRRSRRFSEARRMREATDLEALLAYEPEDEEDDEELSSVAQKIVKILFPKLPLLSRETLTGLACGAIECGDCSDFRTFFSEGGVCEALVEMLSDPEVLDDEDAILNCLKMAADLHLYSYISKEEYFQLLDAGFEKLKDIA